MDKLSFQSCIIKQHKLFYSQCIKPSCQCIKVCLPNLVPLKSHSWCLTFTQKLSVRITLGNIMKWHNCLLILKKLFFSSSLYKAIFNLKTFMLGKLGKLELFIYLLATIKWKKQILAQLVNCTKHALIHSPPKVKRYAISSVTFTLVIPIWRLIMRQYLLQWLFFRTF